MGMCSLALYLIWDARNAKKFAWTDVDTNTLSLGQDEYGVERGRFARICVEIDLRLKLLSRVKVGRRTYSIEYEVGFLFGPWMLAQKKVARRVNGRKHNTESINGSRFNVRGRWTMPVNNRLRFEVLNEEVDSMEVGEEENGADQMEDDNVHKEVARWKLELLGRGKEGVLPRLLRDMCKNHKIDIMIICEPRISGSRADSVIKKFGWSFSIKKEAQGFAGVFGFVGMMIILRLKMSFFHLEVEEVEERIDRGVCNIEWHECFSNYRVVHLPPLCSDHRPVLVTTMDKGDKVSLMCGKAFVNRGIRWNTWSIGDGRNIRFWKNPWLENFGPLEKWLCIDGEPHSLLEGKDVIRWRLSGYGDFSVKSAYDSLIWKNPAGRSSLWKKVWKIASNAYCPKCCNVEESCLHAIRDCTDAKLIWKRLGFVLDARLAWEKGFRRVWFEIDSKVAVNMICNGCDPHHPLARLVREAKSLLDKNWLVKMSYTFREANQVADFIVGRAMLSRCSVDFFANPFEGCGLLLLGGALAFRDEKGDGTMRLRLYPRVNSAYELPMRDK
ncbi:ribonuclease H [Senna tora]|uniref:Ribonuclease H n=1 Tax=Senna tora TaxID=362788 RepID=A0A834XHZ7_9FABA|nr:ribonuclease H [Senna tora]